MLTKKAETSNEFFGKFRGVAAISWCVKLLPIPFSLYIAYSISQIAKNAVDGKVDIVIRNAGVVAFLIITRFLLEFYLSFQYKKRSKIVLDHQKIDFYHHYLSNSLSSLYKANQGMLVENINDDYAVVTNKVLQLYPTIGTSCLTIFAYMGVFCFYSPILAFIIFLIAFLQVLPPLIVRKYMQINYEYSRDIEADITNMIIEGYYGFEIIKTYGIQKWWLNRLKVLHEKYFRIGSKAEITGACDNAMTGLVDNILTIGLYGIVGMLVLKENISFENGIQTIALSTAFFESVKSIFSSIPQLSIARTAEARLFKWYTHDKTKGNSLNKYDIRIDSVTYRHGEKEALLNISAYFAENEISLIKGENGTGKSTLFNLITGSIDCQQGNITIGNVPIKEMINTEFPYNILYLPQDDPEFSFTPMEFYNMFPLNYKEGILNIAELFGLTEVLLNETHINKLSSGQRKKIYLSVAFAINPHLLFMDEPTNSLDDSSIQVLRRLIIKRNKTTVIITHGEFFDDIATKIYVLEKERGLILEKEQCKKECL